MLYLLEMTEINGLIMSNYSIDEVSRDTGIGKDTLRKWESRYRYPTPLRDQQGRRSYSVEQVERLRVIKRLLDTGSRPGQLLTTAKSDWAAIESQDALHIDNEQPPA